MKSKNNIEDGLLELYAMGALNAKDTQQVESALAASEHLRQRLKAIDDALEQYAQAHGIKPNSRVKTLLFDKIKALETGKNTMPAKEIRGTTIPANKSKMFWFSMAASILLLLSIGANIYLYNQNGLLSNQLAASNAIIQNKEAEYVKVYNAYNQLENKFAMAMQPDMQIVKMHGTKDKSIYATIIWDTKSKKVMLSAGNIKQIDKNKTYQLWAMVDGKPVDLGIFADDIKMYELKAMKTISNAQAFAVTIEPKGGSKTPTLEALVLMGKIA